MQPFRQIHLDFHNSEHLSELAADFDAAQFADTLMKAQVDSINLFARCWHGWMYYVSKQYPELVHPNLTKRNLLEEQIEACHRRGIRTPVYVAIQVDRINAIRHPEWVQRTPENRLGSKGVFEPQLGPPLCLNTPFADFLKRHIGELMETVSLDGFWFDGVAQQDCCCNACLLGMERDGIDPENEIARRTFGANICNRFIEEVSALVRESLPNISLFYNAGHIGPGNRATRLSFTHYEIESLPSGGWGYLHFPAVVRYARTLHPDIVGMTGKFHTSWGDFHSFKNRAALEFECFQMLSQGATCSIGDQLHPRGRLCAPTYDLIGKVYEQIRQKQPWCEGARSVVDTAVLTSEGELFGGWHRLLPDGVWGAVRMLQELAVQFDIVDNHADLDAYKLIILPDNVQVDAVLSRKIRKFLQNGNAIIATGASGLGGEDPAFSQECLGVQPVEAPPLAVDYIVPEGFLGDGLVHSEYVMYEGARNIAAVVPSTVLCQTRKPYFDRSWRHFTSHRHAPSNGEIGSPAAVMNGRSLYFAHPLFSIYRKSAPLWCKTLLSNAIAKLLPGPLLKHDGPSGLIATVTRQEQPSRTIIHLLYYIPERRGVDLDIVEDVVPLYRIGLRLHIPEPIEKVRCVPNNRNLPFHEEDGAIVFTLPEICGHQMIEIT